MSAFAAARRLAPPFGALRGAVTPGPRLRRRLVAVVLVATVVGAAYMLWLRDSGLVAVEQVEVAGLTGRDAERVRSALDGAARGMSTLHVDQDALEQAAASFPVVQAIEVEADFPHRLKITVIEHQAVAVLVTGAKRIPVARDGSVLAGLPTEGSLPEIRTGAPVPPAQLEPGATLDAALVAGGAPGVLVPRLDEVRRESERGVVVAVKDGPDLIFGSTDRLAAKWAAAVRVLADPDSAGAEYLDLRLPERPAAGGLAVETVAPVAPAGAPAAPADESIPGAVPVAPETDPTLPAEPVPEAPEAVAPAEPTPGTVAPAPAPADPGGGAIAEPQL